VASNSHDLFNHPFFLVPLLGHEIFTSANIELQKKNCMSLALLKIMVPVLRFGPITQNEIASHLSCTKTAVSKQINTLIDLGLITKQQGTDKREMYIELTTTGVKEVKKGLDVLLPIVKNRFTVLTQEESIQLHTILRKLIPNIQ
jgi:DNA-binding MarR family transcriptional regulator